MLRKAVVLVAFTAIALPAGAEAARTSEQIMPGVTYIREQGPAYGAPLVLRAVIGPKPGGLYDLRPVLSNNLVSGRATVSSMQRALLGRANVVGVNGDLFSWVSGHPSGIFVRAGVLASRPLAERSSLGIGSDGLLRIGRVGYAGSFHVEGKPARRLKQFNRPLRDTRGLTLFVPSWGPRTPSTKHTKEVILSDVGRTFPNLDRTARVVKIVRGSGHRIPPGGAVLQARGDSRAVLRADAAPGATITFTLGLENWWEGVKDAIGGGPLLVRGGSAVYQADESFTRYQLSPRHPRTAVGQLADGRILLVVADGRSSVSYGLTNTQLALQMVRLGAVDAMALDAGGSSTLAFNGRVLNHPSDGRERPVADSLQLMYFGAYAQKPRYATFSPNGDGYADVQRLYAKFVKPSHIDLKLVRPDGVVRWQRTGFRSPGTITKDLSRRALMEGTWRWIVSGVDTKGRPSRMTRKFSINNTLGFLTLSKTLMRVRAGVGGRLRISFHLAHSADASVTIRRRSGRLVRRLTSQSDLAPGSYAVIWNGRNDAGRVVRSGTFTVDVRALNGRGSVALQRSIVVRRVAT